mmetsp:Transcript_14312/g.30495  ORF Transcript_14312/g.30495 Transcript_14312/m.30495 type:complete len:147 (-) Transcript_14312:379-819(-)
MTFDSIRRSWNNIQDISSHPISLNSSLPQFSNALYFPYKSSNQSLHNLWFEYALIIANTEPRTPPKILLPLLPPQIVLFHPEGNPRSGNKPTRNTGRIPNKDIGQDGQGDIRPIKEFFVEYNEVGSDYWVVEEVLFNYLWDLSVGE